MFGARICQTRAIAQGESRRRARSRRVARFHLGTTAIRVALFDAIGPQTNRVLVSLISSLETTIDTFVWGRIRGRIGGIWRVVRGPCSTRSLEGASLLPLISPSS